MDGWNTYALGDAGLLAAAVPLPDWLRVRGSEGEADALGEGELQVVSTDRHLWAEVAIIKAAEVSDRVGTGLQGVLHVGALPVAEELEPYLLMRVAPDGAVYAITSREIPWLADCRVPDAPSPAVRDEVSGFRQWLARQAQDETPLGDLARDIKSDRCLFARTEVEQREHLEAHGAMHAALEVHAQAWQQYRGEQTG